jgi:glycosyltransferase involved in cell wall biosynthesis
MDEIKVPSAEYMDILESRGFNPSKMTLFKRGIDAALFSPREGGRTFLRELIGLQEGVTLLYTGRVSEDKNLDFLLSVYKKLSQQNSSLNLIITGDGPSLPALKEKYRALKRVFFTGKHEQQVMPAIISGADIFVFPSNTDTFGMSVLEAQSCAVPAVVSHAGGPKEIVKDSVTGFVARANDINDWTEKIGKLISMRQSQDPALFEMQKQARYMVLAEYDWNAVLDELTGLSGTPDADKNDFLQGSKPFLVGSIAV